MNIQPCKRFLALGLLAAGGGPALGLPVPSQTLPVGDEPAAVLVIDLDRDGSIDLVSADAGADAVSVLRGDGRGGFEAAVSYPACGQPVAVDAGDIDGDGRLDLVVACFADHSLAMLPGSSGGVLGGPVAVGAVKGPRWVACRDLDGDHRAEIVSADGLPRDRELHVFGMTPAGSFARLFRASIGLQTTAGRIADLDADGHADVAVVSRAEDRVDVVFGDDEGGFGAPVPYPVGRQPMDLLVTDVNGDGLPDLVTADRLDDRISVLAGTGAGSFAGAVAFPAGQRPVALAAGDLDGDCLADLAVAGSVGASVTVLAGDGVGGFVPTATVAGAGNPSAVALADLDGDVRADLVAAVGGTADVLDVLRGSGTACTTFRIRRGADAATVRSGAPLVTVQAGPFDDTPPPLASGELSFWVLEHAGGLDVPLSLGLHPGDTATRVGFDDGDPSSAPVDPFSSTVIASLPQPDGQGGRFAMVSVIPRDLGGVALGRGLDLSVSALIDDPLLEVSPVRDLGNGSYGIRVDASGPGSVTLAVTVEGVELGAPATIVFP